VDNLQFQTLNHMEGVSLIKPFCLEEVTTVVWDCDSYKSPGPDGINYGFIKDFWVNLKDDIMRFILQFKVLTILSLHLFLRLPYPISSLLMIHYFWGLKVGLMFELCRTFLCSLRRCQA